jgi:membrane-bound lytic murein transglycosylase D
MNHCFAAFAAVILLAGCSSTADLNRQSALLQRPPVRMAHPSQERQAFNKSVAVADKSDSLSIAVNRLVNDTAYAKLKKVYALYDSTLKAIDIQNYDKAEDNLNAAIDILSEIAKSREVESDTTFRKIAYFVLTLYNDNIQSIDRLDLTTPAYSLWEKYFSDVDKIKVDETKYNGVVIPKTETPLVLNYQVEQFMTYYQTRAKYNFQKFLNNAGVYFPTLEKIIAEEGVPHEIIYLSIVESGVNPHARSWANALGMWQFITSTGRLYGLQGNTFFDERSDIFKQTRASMRLLKDLHRIYGDWYLALAAYNGGGARVTKAIKRMKGSRDFWAIAKYLRKESRQYVPKYIAVSLMAMNPKAFGFEEPKFGPVIAYNEVTLKDCLPLACVAQCAGISLDTLRFLNPEIRQDITPPAYSDYKLKLPQSVPTDTFMVHYAALPDSVKLHFIAHKMKQGETLKAIAKKYKTTIADISSWNKIDRIIKGKVLMIPTTADVAEKQTFAFQQICDEHTERIRRPWRRRTKRYASAKAKVDKSKPMATYQVKSGDTLSGIAKRHGLSPEDLADLNGLSSDFIKAGTRLAIPK